MAIGLSLEEIEKLANKPNVRKIAVENFLMSVGNNTSEYVAMKNLELDSSLYNWNMATQTAIRKGIKLAFRGK